MTDNAADGTTPLDPDETDGLLHPHVATKGELDELEEENIQIGLEWATAVALRRSSVDVLTEEFLYELHRRMFGEVWKWAGEVRRTNKNIGVDKSQIRAAVRDLVADVRVWRQSRVYEADELAVRLHHRLVAIHPFPNGNGRHARMTADLVVMKAGRPRFTWGSRSLRTVSDLRAHYIDSLRAADRGDFTALLTFARS